MCRPATLAEQKNEQKHETATAGLSVQWQDLTVGVGPKRVPVLRNLTGGASAGALTAVLGPSGWCLWSHCEWISQLLTAVDS